jgi:hypothetical protein
VFSTGNAGDRLAARRWSPRIGATASKTTADPAGLHSIARYRDDDVAIDVFDTADRASVAARSGVPGS